MTRLYDTTDRTNKTIYYILEYARDDECVWIEEKNRECILTIANEKKVRNGPSTNDSGCTQASVSERKIDDDVSTISLSPPLVAIKESIVFIFSRDDTNGIDVGATIRELLPTDADDAIARPRTERFGANPVHIGALDERKIAIASNLHMVAVTATEDVVVMVKRQSRGSMAMVNGDGDGRPRHNWP